MDKTKTLPIYNLKNLMSLGLITQEQAIKALGCILKIKDKRARVETLTHD